MSGDDEDIRGVAAEQVDGEAANPPPSVEQELAAVRAELESATRRLAEQAEDRERLRASRERVKRLEGRALEAKETATMAKKAFEAAMSEHLALEDELDSGQARLPLGEPEGEAVPADDWRSVCLNSLVGADGDPLLDGVLRKLAENDPPLLTMGDVADWSRSGKRLTDVPGIGEAKAEDIEAVLEHFWNQRAVDDPINADIAAGVREAEAHKGAAGMPQDATADAPGWRDVTVGALGLSEATVAILDRQTISTVGELVAIARHGLAWMGDEAAIDVDEALARFRNRRSNDEIAEFDAARDGEAASVVPRGRPSRGRRAGARA